MVIERRTFLVTIFLLIVLTGLGVFILLRYVAPRTAPVPQLQTAPVVTGTLSSLVSTNGSLRAQRQIRLGVRTTGVVSTTYVRPGDRVQAGQVLVQLDDTDQQYAIRKASAALEVAQAKLGQAITPTVTSTTPVSVTQAALEAAWTSYRAAQARYQSAVAAYRSSLTAYQSATTAYKNSTVLYNNARTITDTLKQGTAQANALSAQASARSAQASAQSAQASAQADMASAWAKIQQLQYNLSQAPAAASSQDVLAGQAGIDLAEVVLEQSRADLDTFTVVAPWAGQVISVSAQPGETLRVGVPAVILADTTGLVVSVPVSENQIQYITLGEPVTITVPAAPNPVYTGQVTGIGNAGIPASANDPQVVFPVTVAISSTDPGLRLGMSASVTLPIEQHGATLLVPTRAVHPGAEGGEVVSVVFATNRIVDVPVTMGLSDETWTEVISKSLREGDRVVVNGQAASLPGLAQPSGSDATPSGSP